MPIDLDIVMMTDFRFPGGSSASTHEEISSQHSQGLKTGLLHREAIVLKRKRHFHFDIIGSLLRNECCLLNPEEDIRSKVLLIRHPSVIHPPVENLPRVKADKIILVVNHPPVNAVGRVDYLLPFVIKTLREYYGSKPLVFPIGPSIRDTIATFYDDTITFEEEDWLNVFDVHRFDCGPRIPRNPLRIGRHSRPGREKWPSSAEVLRAAYLVDSKHPVHILGGAEVPQAILGYQPKNWIVFPFGSLDVREFLLSIDVFVYFHHPNWTEAFGRVIAEAMATGLPTILPHHFRRLFKEGAIYADPDEVPEVLQKLSDPETYALASKRARSFIEKNFRREVHVQRLLKIHSGLVG